MNRIDERISTKENVASKCIRWDLGAMWIGLNKLARREMKSWVFKYKGIEEIFRIITKVKTRKIQVLLNSFWIAVAIYLLLYTFLLERTRNVIHRFDFFFFFGWCNKKKLNNKCVSLYKKKWDVWRVLTCQKRCDNGEESVKSNQVIGDWLWRCWRQIDCLLCVSFHSHATIADSSSFFCHVLLTFYFLNFTTKNWHAYFKTILNSITVNQPKGRRRFLGFLVCQQKEDYCFGTDKTYKCH